MTQFAVSNRFLRFLKRLSTGLEVKAMVAKARPSLSAKACVGGVRRWCSAAGLVASSLVLVLATNPVSADVFKYIDQHGNVFFSDEPLTSTGLKLEWKRTATRLAAQNREQSESIRRKQAEVNARLKARSEAEAAVAEVYERR
ncbi:MAG: DUF4124 domain-containing protein, partial [Chromatiaceae bacterium]|nr:DUF4124 domain-containing protein [Chromatiaceae bacterium]